MMVLYRRRRRRHGGGAYDNIMQTNDRNAVGGDEDDAEEDGDEKDKFLWAPKIVDARMNMEDDCCSLVIMIMTGAARCNHFVENA